ncbi:hypothetical protein EC546_01560 [Helicobacter pylori]|nr:hypothetical protein EC546_01560 [Helicobacter pylori]
MANALLGLKTFLANSKSSSDCIAFPFYGFKCIFIIVSKLTLFYGEGYFSLSVGIETDKKGNNSTMKPKGRISVNMLI